MDAQFNEEQEMLRTSVRDFLKAECPTTWVRKIAGDEQGYSQTIWHQMAALGWMGLILPEKYGGSGGTFLDLVVLLEEMGRACLSGPFFCTVVLGSLTMLEAGNEKQKHLILPKIARGEAVVTLAVDQFESQFDLPSITFRALADGESYILNGTKLFVPNAHIADYIVSVAKTHDEPDTGITLFLVSSNEPGITCTLLQTMAGDKQCKVTFEKTRVTRDSVLGEAGCGSTYIDRVLQKAAIAKCAEMVGGAQRVLEMVIDHAKQRIQFGRPIGSFQAVQHHCVNILIDVETSKWITYEAAWMLREDISCNKEVAVAKSWVSEAYRRVCALGHQVLGAVGYCEEHDMPLYTRQAKAAEVSFGDAEFHREKVAQCLGI